MEFLSALAPIAFVFAIAALTKVNALEKELKELKKNLKKMTKSSRRKLYRSNNDKALAGIFGGLGDYFDIDSNLLRIIGLLIFVFTGFVPFLIIYFVAMFIVPSDREKSKEESKNKKEE